MGTNSWKSGYCRAVKRCDAVLAVGGVDNCHFQSRKVPAGGEPKRFFARVPGLRPRCYKPYESVRGRAAFCESSTGQRNAITHMGTGEGLGGGRRKGSTPQGHEIRGGPPALRLWRQPPRVDAPRQLVVPTGRCGKSLFSFDFSFSSAAPPLCAAAAERKQNATARKGVQRSGRWSFTRSSPPKAQFKVLGLISPQQQMGQRMFCPVQDWGDGGAVPLHAAVPLMG